MAGMLMKIACIVVACMMVLAPHAEAITCAQVRRSLSFCMGYLKNGGSLPRSCCKAVKGLNQAANTTPKKRRACECLKSAYKSSRGIKPANAASLPSRCDVHIPYKISLRTNCNRIR